MTMWQICKLPYFPNKCQWSNKSQILNNGCHEQIKACGKTRMDKVRGACYIMRRPSKCNVHFFYFDVIITTISRRYFQSFAFLDYLSCISVMTRICVTVSQPNNIF